MNPCRFYIEYRDGTRVEWRGLSRSQAIALNKMTEKHIMGDVASFGWSEL